MNFGIPGGSAESTRGGGVCRPCLTFENDVAESRKYFIEKNCPSPLAEVAGPGIIRPEINAPHWVQRAGFGQAFVASAQKVMFHGRICVNLA